MSLDPKAAVQFYTKLNRAREHLNHRNLLSSMANLNDALRIKLRGKWLKKDSAAMHQDLERFVAKLSNSKLFKETYGAINLLAGEEEQWLDFLGQLVADEQSLLIKFGQAEELMSGGEYDQATDILYGILDERKDDAEVAIDVGDRFMDHDLFSQAGRAYRQAVEIDPDSIHVLNRLAMSLRKDGKHKEAFELYSRALKMNPTDEGLYYNTARTVFEMGNLKGAARLLTVALKHNPEFEAGKQFLDVLNQRLQRNPAKTSN